jgi:hypothetical protein
VTVLTQAPQSGRDSVRDAGNLHRAINRYVRRATGSTHVVGTVDPCVTQMDLEVEVDVIGYLRPVFGAGTPKQDDKPSSHASSMGERVVARQLCTRAASDATGATVQAGRRIQATFVRRYRGEGSAAYVRRSKIIFHPNN